MTIRAKIRDCIAQRLLEYGDSPEFADDESLVLSARLDSLAVLFIVIFMEQQFGIEFDVIDFDLEDFDTLEQMVAVVTDYQSQHGSRRP